MKFAVVDMLVSKCSHLGTYGKSEVQLIICSSVIHQSSKSGRLAASAAPSDSSQIRNS
jgi:hypothetical protein